MITITDVHKRFGDLHVLRGVSLQVEKGKVVVIIGPSGSGKTTLLRCLNVLEIPSQGSVRIGEVVLDVDHHQGGLRVIPDHATDGSRSLLRRPPAGPISRERSDAAADKHARPAPGSRRRWWSAAV